MNHAVVWHITSTSNGPAEELELKVSPVDAEGTLTPPWLKTFLEGVYLPVRIKFWLWDPHRVLHTVPLQTFNVNDDSHRGAWLASLDTLKIQVFWHRESRDVTLTGCIPFDLFIFSWESKGTPPMPPPQEIRPYSGIINHHCPLIRPY